MVGRATIWEQILPQETFQPISLWTIQIFFTLFRILGLHKYDSVSNGTYVEKLSVKEIMTITEMMIIEMMMAMLVMMTGMELVRLIIKYVNIKYQLE